MLILREPHSASRIADPGIRALVEVRFAQIGQDEPFDADRHGYMIVTEPGDSVAQLEDASSCAILHDPFADVLFGNPDFTPSFEVMEEHHDCYEMLFVTNDDGFGITIFIPKAEGIDAGLLAMCAEYATPAHADS